MRKNAIVTASIFLALLLQASADDELIWSGTVPAYSPAEPPWVSTVLLQEGETYHVLATGTVSCCVPWCPRDCRGCNPESSPVICDGIAQDGNEHYWAAPGTLAPCPPRGT